MVYIWSKVDKSYNELEIQYMEVKKSPGPCLKIRTVVPDMSFQL